MATSISSRLLATACAVVLGTTVAACGGDDDGDADGAAATTTPKKPVGDKAQIEALAVRIHGALASGDGPAVCDNMTAAGRRDVVDYGRAVTRSPGSCSEVVRRIAAVNRSGGVEQERARVVAVRIDGSRAVALVRTPSVSPVPQRYVREDGEWRLRPLGLATAVGATNAP